MKFYTLKNRIIRLDLIRDAHLHENEIYIYYSRGDTRGDRIIFNSNDGAADAFRDLCDELCRM